MQTQVLQGNIYNSPKLLLKRTCTPTISENTDSSTNSIESMDDEFHQLAIKWILSISKRVQKDTHYIAITYLNQFIHKSIYINQQNYEKLALTVLLLASKMNQIYPPKITSLISKCKKVITKQEIIETEASILKTFDYDISVDSTPYTYILKILGSEYIDRIQDCQKLLRVVASYREIYEFGDQMLALAIIYLIIPQYIRDMKLSQNQKIKMLAVRIFNIYNEIKERCQREKENTKMAD